MTSTLEDRDSKRSDGILKAVKMGAVKIPKGVMVCINPTGYAVNGIDSGGHVFAGISYEQADNSTGTAGGKVIRVEKTGEHMFLYNGGDAVQAVMGKEVYLVDNQTVDDDPLSTTADLKCGVVTEVLSAGSVRIRIDGYAK